jgi:HKD family nuclease
MGTELVPGLYERLVDEELAEILDQRPELRAVLCKIDDEDNVGRYAELVAALLAKALRQYKPAERSQVANLLINLLSSQDGLDYLRRRKLIQPPRLLTAVVPQADPRDDLPRPSSSLVGSTLLTGAASDPSLDNELRLEMLTADRVDILVSFIKWAGLRLLMPGFEDLLKRGVMVRVITTSYLGASDPKAVEWLAAQPNVSVRVSYDTRRTRLHAKAYLFHRNSGFTSAYIGSSNMSQAAMTSGLEWNLKVTRSDMASIVDRFAIEFESYWNSYEFEAWDCTAPLRFREAIERERNVGEEVGSRFFADIQPHPFQERSDNSGITGGIWLWRRLELGKR